MKKLLFLTMLTTYLVSFPAAAVTLEFIGELNFSHDTQVKQTAFNGLSALAYDRGKECFYAVSDDRSEINPARYYVLKGDADGGVTVVPKDVVFFRTMDGGFFRKGSVDFEGIVILGNKNLLVSSEGAPRLGIEPSLTEFQLDGRFVRQWELPPQFLAGEQREKGVRENLGFEALTVTPDTGFVFTANEQALHQDGGKTTISKGSPVRIVKYSGDGTILGQYLYMVSPIPNPEGLSALQGGNGLVEMLALDEQNILTLERSWVETTQKVSIRIYHVNLEAGGDVSSVHSLRVADLGVPFLEKTLVLDLETLLPLQDEHYKVLDNMEGMSFGPDLPDGNRTLFLVSDGNFSKKQRTLFLAFKLSL